jgi:hypothetical protein
LGGERLFKKIALASLMLTLVITLTACQQKVADEDTSKIQESIDKIKTKILENFSDESKKETDDNEKDSKNPEVEEDHPEQPENSN